MNNGTAKTQGIYPVSLRDIAGIWQMNEAHWSRTADEVKDSSGNNNHGVSVGDAQVTTFNGLNRSGQFDNAGDYLTLGLTSNIISGAPYTVSLWIKLADRNDAGIPLNGQAPNIMSWYNAAADLFYTHTTTESTTFSWAGDEDWHHLVFIDDGVANVVYFDGVQQVLSAAAGVSGGTTLTVASRFAAGLNEWYGRLNQLMIWSRLLSASEVKVLYTHQLRLHI